MRLPAGGARTAGLVGALALIAAATLTPQDGRGISRLAHWCWQCGALWLADGASNVLLFLPLGVALAARGWRVPVVAAAGCAVTGLVETLQWVGVPPGRLASRGDLVANVLGALLGAALWRLRGWRRPATSGGALALAYAWVAGVAAVAVAMPGVDPEQQAVATMEGKAEPVVQTETKAISPLLAEYTESV